MKKKVLFGLMMFASLFMYQAVKAQTVKFVQTMYVNSYGTEFNGSNQAVFITFSNNYSSFQFTNSRGELINSLGTWSYCNQYFSIYDNGVGGVIATPTGRHFNPRTFTYQGMKGNKKVYRNRRTVCNQRTNSVIGYIDDYIYFNTDMTHFSIYSGGSERDNGINDINARSIDLAPGGYIYVYDAAAGSGRKDPY